MSCKEELPSQRRAEVCRDLHCTHDTEIPLRSKTRLVDEIAVYRFRDSEKEPCLHTAASLNNGRRKVLEFMADGSTVYEKCTMRWANHTVWNKTFAQSIL